MKIDEKLSASGVFALPGPRYPGYRLALHALAMVRPHPLANPGSAPATGSALCRA